MVSAGGWNQEDKIVKKAKQIPVTYPGADHPGPGRVRPGLLVVAFGRHQNLYSIILYHSPRPAACDAYIQQSVHINIAAD